MYTAKLWNKIDPINGVAAEQLLKGQFASRANEDIYLFGIEVMGDNFKTLAHYTPNQLILLFPDELKNDDSNGVWTERLVARQVEAINNNF